MVWDITFVCAAAVLCALSVMAILGVTEIRMSGSDAIQRDGLARGLGAPRWHLPDSTGRFVQSPSSDPEKPFQLVMFTDHSLKSFPSVVEGLKALSDDEALEVIVLLDRENSFAEPVIRMLGLNGVSIVVGTRSLYGSYNVRVKPWAIFVDSDGIVRGSSLVNHEWQLARLWRLAQLPLSPEEIPQHRRNPRRRLGVVAQ
jgi:hypothetical protein